jgi:hypothetical protein
MESEKDPRDQGNSLTSCFLDYHAELAFAELRSLELAVEDLQGVMERAFVVRLQAQRECNSKLLTEFYDLQRQLQIQRSGYFRARMFVFSLLNGFGYLAGSFKRRAGANPVAGSMLLLSLALVFCGFHFFNSFISSSRGAVKPAALKIQMDTTRLLAYSLLSLRADQSCWVEVQDIASGEIIYVGEIAASKTLKIRLRNGLKIRAGRPEVLWIAFNDDQEKRFDIGSGLDWREFKPRV